MVKASYKDNFNFFLIIQRSVGSGLRISFCTKSHCLAILFKVGTSRDHLSRLAHLIIFLKPSRQTNYVAVFVFKSHLAEDRYLKSDRTRTFSFKYWFTNLKYVHGYHLTLGVSVQAFSVKLQNARRGLECGLILRYYVKLFLWTLRWIFRFYKSRTFLD